MASYENMNVVWNKMRNSTARNSLMENLALASHSSNEVDIRRTLELLNVTYDINLQIKLFSILSTCILNKDENFDVIIKYSAVYDRTYDVLQKGLPRKAEYALNFLMTLLYVDAEEERGNTQRRTLAIYAKNMIRTSGCLGLMTDMFTNSMMFHDTWNALCHCLAAVCSGSELNQAYCSHLIPVCIQRSNQTHIEIFLVLNSLLQNQNRNIELFLKSNGLSIFTRELLHYDKCLQVLISVAQRPASHAVLQQGQILNDLRSFLHMYGPSSQIGQSAKIILNHIARRSIESSSQCHDVIKKPIPNNNKTKYLIESNKQRYGDFNIDDTDVLMQNIIRETKNFNQNQFKSFIKTKAHTNSIKQSRAASPMTVNNERQNNNRRDLTKNKLNRTKRVYRNPRDSMNINSPSNLTFSFLCNKDFSKNMGHAKIVDKSEINKDRARAEACIHTEYNLPSLYTTWNEQTMSDAGFEPKFSSTPKRDEFAHSINYSECSIKVPKRQSNYDSDSMEKTRESHMPTEHEKTIGNKSLGSRFFTAINQTCTTVMKTVTSIFKKKDTPASRRLKRASRAKHECSYSFLKFMQKRDAFFKNLEKTSNNDLIGFSMGTGSCDTCDTQTLKKKIKKNYRLKQTVKKLKLGINLYGCDFKKISKTMWPRDPSMTPLVLYNLYRKLLLK